MNKLQKTKLELHEFNVKQINLIKELFISYVKEDIDFGYFRDENLEIKSMTFRQAEHSDCDGHSGVMVLNMTIKGVDFLPTLRKNNDFMIRNSDVTVSLGYFKEISFTTYFYFRLPDNLY